MKQMILLMLMVAGTLAPAAQTSEAERMKSELVGHTMGGREKSWKFQSVDQIKELEIKNKTEDAEKLVCTVSMTLQAGSTAEKYAAEARVEYVKTGNQWKVKQVGLLSLAKIE